MPKVPGTRRVCGNGHAYIKTSSCPVCPICEKQRAPEDGILSLVAAPARRALEGAGLTTLAKLAKAREAEVMGLHGMGPNAMGKLKAALKAGGLSFRA